MGILNRSKKKITEVVISKAAMVQIHNGTENGIKTTPRPRALVSGFRNKIWTPVVAKGLEKETTFDLKSDIIRSATPRSAS